MTVNYSLICRNIGETKRLMKLTAYQRSNERAADRKADAWLHYTPLQPAQLADGDSEYITIVSADIAGDATATRSTLEGEGDYHPQFKIIQRPTERLALHGSHLNEDNDPTICRSSRRQERWCIYCKDRHPEHDFLQSKRYLNGLSYACKRQLNLLRRKPWHFARPPLDTSIRITIEKPLRQFKDDKAALRTSA